ncbi:MAG TPA: tetratricopeptide repeat protein [Steroidobacteraceae bacterium]|jgi:tetratricopeptide (TPR) repeat protein|nr:tetratricopeptide repeat protein [Steroidobacteraceae bacterium]
MRVRSGILGLTLALMIAPVGMSFANGGGTMSGGSTAGSMSGSRPGTPEEMAKAAYNSGVHSIKKAQEYESDAAKASNPDKSAKALDKAHQNYSKALEQFIDAVSQQPKMYQAWNYIGFANRHLGSYDAALSAYAKALEINPGYPDAIEYRGEAYLGLNKIDEAKEAYMTLFKESRSLADQLMAAMRRWTDARRTDAQGVAPEELEAFSKWVEERVGIAAQTASLAVGARTAWK